MPIDYSRSAEFCASPHAKLLEYRRFASASDALKFAVEDWPDGVVNAWIRVGEEEYADREILAAYYAEDCP